MTKSTSQWEFRSIVLRITGIASEVSRSMMTGGGNTLFPDILYRIHYLYDSRVGKRTISALFTDKACKVSIVNGGSAEEAVFGRMRRK